MSVIDDIGRINKDIRSFELKLKKPGTAGKARQEILKVIKDLKAKKFELCKKL